MYKGVEREIEISQALLVYNTRLCKSHPFKQNFGDVLLILMLIRTILDILLFLYVYTTGQSYK